jgi:NitT/TauT family transport system ATP-binding protein
MTIQALTPIAEPDTLVAVDNLRHLYDRGVVLDDISIRLRDGEIVALLGRSGCGKSTLLRIIAGLMPATGGDVSLDGQHVDGPADGVAMVFQSFALFPWLTVLENVELGLEAQGVTPRSGASARSPPSI